MRLERREGALVHRIHEGRETALQVSPIPLQTNCQQNKAVKKWALGSHNLGPIFLAINLLGGAVTWRRGFVKCFLRVPELFCSSHAAQAC